MQRNRPNPLRTDSLDARRSPGPHRRPAPPRRTSPTALAPIAQVERRGGALALGRPELRVHAMAAPLEGGDDGGRAVTQRRAGDAKAAERPAAAPRRLEQRDVDFG